MQKCNSDFTEKSRLAATVTEVNVAMVVIALLVAHIFGAVLAILASLWRNLA